jgi:hypothetical protein
MHFYICQLCRMELDESICGVVRIIVLSCSVVAVDFFLCERNERKPGRLLERRKRMSKREREMNSTDAMQRVVCMDWIWLRSRILTRMTEGLSFFSFLLFECEIQLKESTMKLLCIVHGSVGKKMMVGIEW